MNRVGLITAALTIFAGTAAADTKQTPVDQQPVSAVSPVELRSTLHEEIEVSAENVEARKEVRPVRVILPSPYGRDASNSPIFQTTR